MITKHVDMFDIDEDDLPTPPQAPLFATRPQPPVEIGRPSLFAVEPPEERSTELVILPPADELVIIDLEPEPED
jgi:hypothetical protein